MDEDKKVLNLDDLFGAARAAVQVRFDGEMYDLAQLDSFTPRQLQRFQAIGKQAFKLKDAAGVDITASQATQVEKLIDDMLIMLCPTLPLDKMKTAMKMAVLQHYEAQTQAKKAPKTTPKK